MSSSVDSLLNSLQHLGVHLGLERIESLLQQFDSPHLKVPIIHVAGTNGKGSVCAYLSTVLTKAGYRIGCYTSPHLVDWNERICLNLKPISTKELTILITNVLEVITREAIPLTQFEVITAVAWLYFAQNKVDLAVIEVGLGGRLDATNIVPHPLVTVITSISRDHWQILGSNLSDIAREKAGILKAKCPAIIGELPLEAEIVIKERIEELDCSALWVKPAQRIKENWAQWREVIYPLPLLGDVQLMNSALAVATLAVLQEKGWDIPETAISWGMSSTQWKGRLQWLKWRNNNILIDGAHNPAAAQVLRAYVDSLNRPVHWVIGMLASKDHQDIFKALLRPGDDLSLVPVPNNSTADLTYLGDLAQSICPELNQIDLYGDLMVALEKINPGERVVVLSGSLYLVGYFLAYADQFTQS